MNSNEKRWIVLLVAVVLIAVILIVVLTTRKGDNENVVQNAPAGQEEVVNEEKYTTELDDGTKINTSEEFNSAKTYGNLSISNMQFTESNGVSVMLADVTNNGSTAHEPEIVKVTILGDNNEVITEIKPVIGKIEPGETIKLNASITADVANARDFKIEAND